MAFLPPGGPTEIVFSFDTTGSMSAILEEVQSRLQDMIQRLQSDIPGIKISVIAHGDYCDAEHFYVTKHMDFCDSIPELCNFVNEVGGTGGGDVPECYELVLRMVREQLSWQPMSQKVLIMIGDAYPHEADFPENTLNIDWKDEIKELTKMGVRIYGVQAGEDETSRDFFTTLATDSGGQYLKLDDFSNICTFIMAICYRERGDDFLSGFEAEIRAGKGKASIGKDLEGLFGSLRRDESMESEVSGPSALVFPTPVSPISSFTDGTSGTPAKAAKTVRTVKAARTVKTARVNGPKPIKAKAQKPTKQHVVVKKTASKVSVRRNVKAKPKREKVTQNNFAFKDYQWSKWHLAMVPYDERENLTNFSRVWREVPNTTHCGFKKRNINLFPSAKSQSHILVEVAVQARPHARKQVVMFKLIHGVQTPTTWYRALFCKRKLKSQLRNVLKSGCKVFVRSAVVVKSKQPAPIVRREFAQTYDYAWFTSRASPQFRDLYLPRYGVHISSCTA